MTKLNTFTVVLALVAGLAGCAQDVGDVDRTQPNRLKKTLFEGEWFHQKTTFDVPYTAGFSFTGETSLLERVRWDVQEQYLIAYRTYELIENTLKPTELPGVEWRGAPVAAYAITSHFDVVRDYNPQTGEETNVIAENEEDRPWYEREYIRVDWSKNLVVGFSFLDDQVKQSPISYYVQDRSDADRLLIGVRDGDSWSDHQDWEEIAKLDRADYIDVVDQIFVDPVEETYDEDGVIVSYPECWFYSVSDCQPAPVKIRSSFLKIDPEASFEAMAYPDNSIARRDDGTPYRDAAGNPVRVPWFDRFGYFRVERDNYDRERERTESGRTYLINRWNIWKDAPACKTGNSYAGCAVKPIVYHLSPGFPEELKAEALHTINEWNDAFKQVVNHLKYGGSRPLDQVEDVVVLYDNNFAPPGADGGGERGQRIGDLRYSFLYYIPEPQLVGPLGYGPSAVDPLTGEIIGASAYIYGAALESFAAWGADIVQLLNGAIPPDDFIDGEDVRAYVARARGDYAATAGDEARRAEERLREGRAFARSEPVRRGRAKQAALGKRKMRLDRASMRARLNAIEDTELEDRLISDEVIRALVPKARNRSGDLLSSLDPDARRRLSPTRFATPRALRAKDEERRLKLRRSNLELAEFADDGVLGLAEALRGQDWQSVRQTILLRVFASTSEHELGHTFGLRHNFAGSFDALNYGTEFWSLRGDAPIPFQDMTREQALGRMREHQYSSIMDYGARFNSDIQGLGHYDVAAILFGYGQLVEVFETPPTEPIAELYGLEFALHQLRHYTSLPRLFGGSAANMYRRRVVPYRDVIEELVGNRPESLVVVPYRFCSDEYEAAIPDCNTYDEGADPYEVVKNAFDTYERYYIFNSFSRDRRELEPFDYMSWVGSRFFSHAQVQYQDWVFRFFDQAAIWESELRADPGYYGIEDVPFEEAIDGNLAGGLASRLGVNALGRVLQTPEPGAYYHDADENLLINYSYDTTVPVCAPGHEDDPDCSNLTLPLGEGKYAFSFYDGDSGYYFYDRVKVVGSFYDKLAALEALTSPDTYFLGVDSDANLTEYAISMFLYFPEQVARLVGGSAVEQYGVFAGVRNNGVFEYRDMFAETPPPPSAVPVDPATSFTIELYSAWLGMAFLNANFDNSFNDLMRIWEEGSGDGVIPSVTDPARIARFTHPRTGRVFVAIRHERPEVFSPGWALVNQAQRYLDETSDPELRDYQVENAVAIMEAVRGMHELYGKLYF